MSRPDHHHPIPDALLELYALGELDPDQHATIAHRRETDPDLDRRLEALERSNAAILAEQPPARFAAAVRAKLDRPAPESPRAERPTRRWLLLTPAVAGAALAAALLLQPGAPGPEVRGSSPEITRTKGFEPHLRVYRRSDQLVERLAAESPARAGDVLQLAYVAAGATHGVILSLDGNGVVTLHHPESDRGSSLLNPDGEIPVPHAYELDDAPGYERFVLITQSSPVEVDVVLQAARKVAEDPDTARETSLDLPESMRQHTLVILKESSR